MVDAQPGQAATGRGLNGPRPPPLGIYVHIPWCRRKCAYCDFNSYPGSTDLPEQAYVDALLRDLDQELPLVAGRRVGTLFIGGGTPSLLSGAAIQRLLDGIRARLELTTLAEITLEANPGSAEAARFQAYRDAGVNRLSLGVQTLEPAQLRILERIHGPGEARDALGLARRAGFTNINLDLMYGLPGQDLASARRDLEQVLDWGPEHLSYYQLTLEAGTPFGLNPPLLPDEDLLDAIETQGKERLAGAGFRQYEVSAYARPGRACRHNLGYWSFADYLGLGAGAHGKLTLADGRVQRRWKQRRPNDYLGAADQGHFLAGCQTLDPDALVLEFMLNALRLKRGFSQRLFQTRTGLAPDRLAAGLELAQRRGLLEPHPRRVRPSPLGWRFLDDLMGLFA